MTFFLQSLVNAISLGSLYALVALGLAMVFSVMRLVNFAHGEIIMVGAYTAWALQDQGWVVWLLGTLIASGVCALLMERAAFRPVRGANLTTLLVTSFAVSNLVQNGGLLLAGGRAKPVSLSEAASASVTIGSIHVSRLALFTIAAAALLLGAFTLFLKRTRLGLQMRAAAEDFPMAQLVGVRADWVIALSFAIAGVLAGVAALILAENAGAVVPGIGLEPVIVAFVAIVIGGMGSLAGAVVGGFALGLITTMLQAYLPGGLTNFRDAFVYAAVIAILLLRPQGLLASPAETERI